ncbi:P-loop ATPase, Sll1717 family [Desulfonatronum lacustre]|uniref:P-loop ATPase, Sll1717 family n=1 Tax=Desulfonatronum lacustre TaxID=66849 RepID=UPI00048DE8F1|nr:hypothetical protein [Desulfonatronum lacustre]
MLKLKDIYVGDVDAKNELIEASDSEALRFIKSFTVNDGIDIDDYFSGKMFFITGLKGTGKTAFLRYLSLLAKRKHMNSLFVLFKSNIKETDRAKLSKNSDTIVIEEKGSIKYIQDYEKIWMLFLHKTILNLLEKTDQPVFIHDDNWKKYKYAVLGADYGNKALGVLRYFPTISKGMINFFIPEEYKDYFQIDLGENNAGQVNFSLLVNTINEFFSNLTPSEGKVFLFVDELELNLGSQEQYKRDILLIRDLIIAVEHLNREMAIKNFPVKIFCAARREVITAVDGIGKEIAKPTEDFGVELIWNSRIGSENESFDHPLIQLIAKKINVSEEIKGIQSDFECEELIYKYFPQSINGIHITKYLLDRSWFRPRDFSRMLRQITKQYGKMDKGFTQACFEGTQKAYATSSWTEIAEELAAKYKKGTIRSVEKLFSGVPKQFSFEDIQKIAKTKSKHSRDLDEFIDSRNLSELLADLFQIGFIGNSNPFRFHFRGDANLNLEADMVVHRALWPYFSII